MHDDAVTGRLAPSPTGALHLGHAVSFLAAWWSARHQGGRVVLRFEDVDAERANHEHLKSALDDLQWLGLDWDGEPQIQSSRTPSLRRAAEGLAQRRLAYPCVCTRGDLARAHAQEEQVGAPQGPGERPYPGLCRNRFATIGEAERIEGKDAGLRFLVKPGMVSFVDAVFGEVRCDVASQVGDFLILRRDKTPAYQLAIVLDDAQDGVTEVIRGRDLLDSTCRQILIARALGLSPVRYAHIPLICDHTGKRLAKRDQARSLFQLRRDGVSADRVIRWAARILCQSPDALIGSATKTDQVQLRYTQFDRSRIPREDIRLTQDFSELV